MPTPSPIRVRFAIVGIVSVLALGFLMSPGRAQPGRPNGFGGFGGRPPGGISGMPGGGITGHPGGISGMPGGGIGGFPSLPPVPQVPPIHPPGGFGPSSWQDEWRCSGCKYLVGTGPTKPLMTRCPNCNARFSNGLSPGFNPPPVTSPGGTGAPAANPDGAAPQPTPTLPTNPAVGDATLLTGTTASGTPQPSASPPPAPTNPSPAPAPAAGADSEAGSYSASNTRFKLLKFVGFALGLFLLACAMAALGFVVVKASSTTPAKRTRRRFRDDEYDDE